MYIIPFMLKIPFPSYDGQCKDGHTAGHFPLHVLGVSQNTILSAWLSAKAAGLK